ncbi:MAG: TonB family protein [Candidatus Omnitrophota bacterium]|jgi:pilus assembly protein CpaC
MREILRTIFLLFFIILVGYNHCSAQETYKEGELVTLYVREIKVISVNNPTRVAISNPDVADVTSTSKDEMVVIAKDAGTTNLIWWDSLGQHALQLQVFLEDMGAVKQRIDRLLKELNLPGVYTRRADSEGKVLLLGKIKTEEDMERIDTALGELNEKVTNLITLEEETASIEIEVQILELSRDATEDLGFSHQGVVALAEPSGRYGNKVTDIPDALFHLMKWSRQDLVATLDFLIQEGKARILSRPRLVCQSGKEAELLVGGEKPIMTTSFGSLGEEGTDIEYKEYGIKLNIRPRVASEDRIQVSLNVEVSELTEAETLGSESSTATSSTTVITALAYPLIKRNTSTEVLLGNGQTLAISGLIKQKTEEEVRKLPWLGDIPILGLFFRSKKSKAGGGRGELGDTELVITLTPTILEDIGAFPEAAISTEEEERGDMRLVKTERTYPDIRKPAVATYTRMIISQIQNNFVYPDEAYEQELEGTVRLSLYLASTGELKEVAIKQSSGSRILDENAIRIINRIAPFPAFPPGIEEKELRINIPISYNIE